MCDSVSKRYRNRSNQEAISRGRISESDFDKFHFERPSSRLVSGTGRPVHKDHIYGGEIEMVPKFYLKERFCFLKILTRFFL